MLRIVLLLSLLVPSVASAVPQLVTYSGRILDDAGEPVEGEVVITVALFPDVEDPTIESELGFESWSEEFTTIAVNGYFAVVLGSSTPLSADDLAAGELYVTLRIDSGPWMVPASRLTSSAYAIQAESAERADSADVAVSLLGGSVDATDIKVDGTPVVSETGVWIGPIATSENISVGTLSINNVPFLNNSGWVGPVPNFPEGTTIDATEVLVGTALNDQIDALIDSDQGTQADTNPKNHSRYTKEDLALDLAGVSTIPELPTDWAEWLWHQEPTTQEIFDIVSASFLPLTGGETIAGTLGVGGVLDVQGQTAPQVPASIEFSIDGAATNGGPETYWSIQADAEGFGLYEEGAAGAQHFRIEDNTSGDASLLLQPGGYVAGYIDEGVVEFTPVGSAGKASVYADDLSVNLLVSPLDAPALGLSRETVNADPVVSFQTASGTEYATFSGTGISLGTDSVAVTLDGAATLSGGATLSVDRTLNLDGITQVTGLIRRDGCPDGTDEIRSGAANLMCIDNTYRSPATSWGTAMNDCADDGMTLCAVWQLAMCDLNSTCAPNSNDELDRPPSNYDLGADTELASDAEFWTINSAANGNNSDAMKFMAYNVRSSSDETQDDLVESEYTEDFYYYCCLGAL